MCIRDSTKTVPKGYSWSGDKDGVYITEVYTDGYNWANPFVGLSQYYKNGAIKAYLPKWVSVTPASRPGDTRVECGNDVGFYFGNENGNANSLRFLWGFRSLTKLTQPIPSEPDKVCLLYTSRGRVRAAGGNSDGNVLGIYRNLLVDQVVRAALFLGKIGAQGILCVHFGVFDLAGYLTAIQAQTQLFKRCNGCLLYTSQPQGV